MQICRGVGVVEGGVERLVPVNYAAGEGLERPEETRTGRDTGCQWLATIRIEGGGGLWGTRNCAFSEIQTLGPAIAPPRRPHRGWAAGSASRSARRDPAP